MKYLVLIMSLFFMGCASNKTSEPLNPSPVFVNGTGAPLYVYGDSISLGMSAPSYAQLFTMANNFNLVQQSVGATALFYYNQYSLILADQTKWPKNAVIMFSPGENDGLIFGDDTAYEQIYTQGVQAILDVFKTSGLKVYFGTPNHNCNPARFGNNNIPDIYANINRTLLANENAPNITLIDYNANFTPTTSNTLDCIHPNPVGNQQMFEYLLGNM